jgi:membrane protein
MPRRDPRSLRLVRQVAREVASPWQLGGLTVPALGRRVYDQIWKDGILDHAAALSYYFLFALFPTLLFLTALFGMLPTPGLMDGLMSYVDQVLPGDAASLVHKTLTEVVGGASRQLLSMGVVLALWAASSGMASTMAALNAAYDVDDPRPWWKRRLIALGLTVLFSLFTVTAMLLLVFGPKIASRLADAVGLAQAFALFWMVATWPVLLALALLGIALVYYLAPAVRQQWRWVTPGSVFTLAVWIPMSVGLREYVARFGNYNATYGSIGGVILLLLWLYLASVVLLIGAEINSEIEHAAAEHGHPAAKAEGERIAPEERAADAAAERERAV